MNRREKKNKWSAETDQNQPQIMTATANITSAHQPNATWNVNHAVSHQPNQRNGVFVSLIFTIMFAWNIESSSFERIFSLLRKDHIKKISPVFSTLVSAHTKKQQESHEFFIETFSSTWNDTNKCYPLEKNCESRALCDFYFNCRQKTDRFNLECAMSVPDLFIWMFMRVWAI